MTEVSSTPRRGAERPDAAGIVLRGAAAEFVRGYEKMMGKPPTCTVGKLGGGSLAPAACDRSAVMDVYGLPMCELHGEEAAGGALEEIAFDLENELERAANPHSRPLSPHLERALRYGMGSLPDEAYSREHADTALLKAFPLDRDRVEQSTLDYLRDPDSCIGFQSPIDSHMDDRMLLCRHMRLAFEEGASWLVEILEPQREVVAAQVAYALALEKEAERL